MKDAIAYSIATLIVSVVLGIGLALLAAPTVFLLAAIFKP